jgi:hypothetical protein
MEEGQCFHPKILLTHGIFVIISNYTNAMEKQNFRMNSGNFAVP